jgi:mevalonyl-CoA ligase
MGFLATFCHGASIVYPSDVFDASKVLDSVYAEKCTILLGVPTMFVAELEALKKKSYTINTIRNGITGGSLVPGSLMKQLERKMGCKKMLVVYGMTETSPVTFMTRPDDDDERSIKTLGNILPHTSAKIVDKQGQLVRRGQRGELCISGYTLQKGYLRNEEATEKAMKSDEDGVVWLHTGDECAIDDDGYCIMTGRIKDIIIRGMYLQMSPNRIYTLTTTCQGVRTFILAKLKTVS